jgi:hypothetical protein
MKYFLLLFQELGVLEQIVGVVNGGGMSALDMSRVILLIERSHGADLEFFMYSWDVRGALFGRFAKRKTAASVASRSCPVQTTLAKSLSRRARG